MSMLLKRHERYESAKKSKAESGMMQFGTVVSHQQQQHQLNNNSHNSHCARGNPGSIVALRGDFREEALKQDTFEYYRGCKRESIFAPMSNLDRTLTFNSESVALRKQANNSNPAPCSMSTIFRQAQVNRGVNAPDYRAVESFDDVGVGRMPESDSLINIPKNGEEALREFLITRKVAAFRKDIDLSTMQKVFGCLQQHAAECKEQRRLILEALAFFQLNRATCALKIWGDWTTRSKAMREMRTKSDMFFRSKTLRSSWQAWEEYLNYRGSMSKAGEFFAATLRKKIFEAWKEHMTDVMTMTIAVTFCNAKAKIRGMWRAKLFLLAQRDSNLNFDTARVFREKKLKRTGMACLSSFAHRSRARNEVMEDAADHRRLRLLCLGLERFSYYTSRDFKKYKEMVFEANSHAACSYARRAIQGLKSYARERSLKSYNCSLGDLHYNRRLATRSIKFFLVNVIDRQNGRWLCEDADSFYVQTNQSKFLTCLCDLVRRGREAKLKLRLADRHCSHLQCRRFVKRLHLFKTMRSTMRVYFSTAMSFRANLLRSRYYAMWKARCVDIKRQRALLRTLKDLFQHGVLEHFFNVWAKHQDVFKIARAGLSRWREITSAKLKLRMAVNMWRHGLFARVFGCWKGLVAKISARLEELADRGFSLWSERNKRAAIKRLRDFSVMRIERKRQLSHALLWIQGNFLLKMFVNWRKFVERQMRLKRAVGMWRRTVVKRCFWGFARYSAVKSQKRLNFAKADECFERISMARGLRRFQSYIGVEYKARKCSMIKALRFMQGHILFVMLARWKAFVETQLNLRKAASMFMSGLQMRSFRKLKAYSRARARGYTLKKQGDHQYVRWRLAGGMGKFKALISEDCRLRKRQVASSLAWFLHHTKIKCYHMWVAHVKDAKKMRRAITVFNDGLLFRCLAKLRVYKDGRILKYEAMAKGEEHFAATHLRKGFLKISSNAQRTAEVRKLLNRSFRWFTDSTLKKCFGCWVTFLDVQRKLHFAANFFNQRSAAKVWLHWTLYVQERYRDKERKRRADDSWAEMTRKRVLNKFVAFAEERRHTRRLLGKAKFWSDDILLYKTYYLWIDFVREMHLEKKALGIWRNTLLYRSFSSLRLYLAYRLRKIEQLEDARLHWEEKKMAVTLRKLRFKVIYKSKMRKAYSFFSMNACLKFFSAWCRWVRGKIKKRQDMALADESYERTRKRCGFRSFVWNFQAVQYSRAVNEIADEHFKLSSLMKKAFCNWCVFVDSKFRIRLRHEMSNPDGSYFEILQMLS